MKIVFIVNGVPVSIDADPGVPLYVTYEKALAKTGNVRFQTWELRNELGVLLDADKTPAMLDLAPNVVLYLSLRAGIGGSGRIVLHDIRRGVIKAGEVGFVAVSGPGVETVPQPCVPGGLGSVRIGPKQEQETERWR